MKKTTLMDFLFNVVSEANTIPMESRVSLISLYTVFLCTLAAVPFNMVRDWDSSKPALFVIEGLFFILVLISVFSFWRIRNLRLPKKIMSAGIAILASFLVLNSGGARGMGFLYFMAGYSVLFHVLGVIGGVLLPLLVFIGAIAGIFTGSYGPVSIFNDKELLESFLLSFFVATIFGIISVIYQHQLIKYLAHAAYIDPVTALANRTKLEEYLDELLHRSGRKKQGISIIAVKVLDFNRINANLGGSGADSVLREFTCRIKSLSPPSSFVGRYTGTVFLIISDLNSIPEIASFLEKLETSLAYPYLQDDRAVSLLFRLAITRFPDDGQNQEKLLANIQTLLSQTGTSSRQIRFYDDNQFVQEQRRYLLGEDLKLAIEKNELTLVYHPKIRFSDERCGGAEVLLRWKSSRHGTIGPEIFIPLAERSGFIRTITRWVLEQSFKEISELSLSWGSLGDLVFAVNLSPLDLDQVDLPAFIEHTIGFRGLNPKNFEFEITEGVLIEQNATVQKVLESLRDQLFRLAIDDFGTGYSSLSYLHRLRVNNLKIDQSFIRSMGESKDSYRIVDAIISMGNLMGLDVTAEGVETEPQAQYLKKSGCTYAQGWLYTRPLSLSDFQAWYEIGRNPFTPGGFQPT
jgi:diguanylate cyclase (GGDEF)-like protein